MSKNPSISLRSRWLSEKLKAARRRAGYTLVEAAEYIQMDHTSLGRFERGTHRIRRSYVKDLLDFYGVSSQREREFLMRLSEDAWRKNWSDMNALDLETEFIDYTWLEAEANKILVFEPLLIHGLLQTMPYVEALTRIEQGERTTKAEITRVADVRKSRQRILTGDSPTSIELILEEVALRRPIGGRATLIGQLNHLLQVGERSNATIRILSIDAKADPGHHGPFTVFEMPDPYPAIAYVENLVGRSFFEEESTVELFCRTYDELRELSLTPKRSLQLIKDIMKDLE